MTTREQICRRHGLTPSLAPYLRGETPAELEADAAARAAIERLAKNGDQRQQPEPRPEPEQKPAPGGFVRCPSCGRAFVVPGAGPCTVCRSPIRSGGRS